MIAVEHQPNIHLIFKNWNIHFNKINQSYFSGR
jgi:hypothetical protein